MARPDGISETESAARQKIADQYNLQNDISDTDALLDQRLYILGKMDIEEYQSYLFFKHGRVD